MTKYVQWIVKDFLHFKCQSDNMIWIWNTVLRWHSYPRSISLVLILTLKQIANIIMSASSKPHGLLADRQGWQCNLGRLISSYAFFWTWILNQEVKYREVCREDPALARWYFCWRLLMQRSFQVSYPLQPWLLRKKMLWLTNRGHTAISMWEPYRAFSSQAQLVLANLA